MRSVRPPACGRQHMMNLPILLLLHLLLLFDWVVLLTFRKLFYKDNSQIPSFSKEMLRTAAGTKDSSFLCFFRRAYTVLSFGDCSQGALGHSHGFLSDSYEAAPVEDLPGDVIKIASGHYHSFAISSNGNLWSWGRNNEGQLGRSSKESRLG